MNFFGHALVAHRIGGSAAVVLGAMLPDLTAMAALPRPVPRRDDLARGVALHHRTDAVFHQLSAVRRLFREGARDLGVAGLARGPARAAAHVGVELLLDGVLAPERAAHAAFRAALTWTESRPDRADLFLAEDASRGSWRELIDLITASRLPDAYADPAATARRLVRILGRRPRLAAAAGDEERLARWLAHLLPTVAELAPDLVLEVLDGVATPS